MQKLIKYALIGCLTLVSNHSISQKATPIDTYINQGKGTFVIRSIKKNKKLDRDSAELKIRFFSSFCQLLKPGPNPFHFFQIDETAFSNEENGVLVVNVESGWHQISLNMNYSTPFNPFKPTLLKFKKRKTYILDFYFPEPFSKIAH
ncbi:MAG: hypothetical protein HOP10_00500 [Chitinophagaceae bacterium]|nr:hypothetical protein [Chitinophagaceae bacterium]